MDTQLKDSGARREFGTGSVRDVATGKGRFDLLSMISLILDAKHMEKGANKYSDRNWELGQPLSTYFNSGFRHLVKAMMGLTDEPHWDAAVWNFNCLRHTLRLIEVGELSADLNDLPKWKDGTAEKLAAMLFPDFEAPPEKAESGRLLLTPISVSEWATLPVADQRKYRFHHAILKYVLA